MGRIRRKLDPACRPRVAGGGEARPGRSRHAAAPSASRRGPGTRRGRWRRHGRGDVRFPSSARPALSRAARCDPRPLRRAELRRVPTSRAWRAGGRGLFLRGGGLARQASRGRGRRGGPLSTGWSRPGSCGSRGPSLRGRQPRVRVAPAGRSRGGMWIHLGSVASGRPVALAGGSHPRRLGSRRPRGLAARLAPRVNPGGLPCWSLRGRGPRDKSDR